MEKHCESGRFDEQQRCPSEPLRPVAVFGVFTAATKAAVRAGELAGLRLRLGCAHCSAGALCGTVAGVAIVAGFETNSSTPVWVTAPASGVSAGLLITAAALAKRDLQLWSINVAAGDNISGGTHRPGGFETSRFRPTRHIDPLGIIAGCPPPRLRFGHSAIVRRHSNVT